MFKRSAASFVVSSAPYGTNVIISPRATWVSTSSTSCPRAGDRSISVRSPFLLTVNGRPFGVRAVAMARAASDACLTSFSVGGLCVRACSLIAVLLVARMFAIYALKQVNAISAICEANANARGRSASARSCSRLLSFAMKRASLPKQRSFVRWAARAHRRRDWRSFDCRRTFLLLAG